MDFNLKLATWNILWTDFDFDKRIDEIAANLFGIDIVCLQEVREDSVFHAGEELANKLGLSMVSNSHYATSDKPKYEMGVKINSVILSKYPAIESGIVDTKNGDYGLIAFALLDTPYRPTLVFSAHLDWGGEKEFERLAQVKSINEASDLYLERIKRKYGSDPIVVIAGDFNTEPDSQTIAYLRGKQAYVQENQAYWVDAWAAANPGADGYTSVPSENDLAYKVGAAHVFEPSMIPPRRIDYIFVKGWAYGKPGHALSAELLGTRSLLGDTLGSDHYGIVAELWNPAPQKTSDE
jgi:endonuclease/exonuclease/phosphatase family metal-dependent hydrolase